MRYVLQLHVSACGRIEGEDKNDDFTALHIQLLQ